MKNKIICVLLLIVTCSTVVKSQDSIAPGSFSDISIFENYRIHDSKNPLLWYVREEVDYYFEARMNFDWSNTAGLVFGKTFSKSDLFWVTPKAGALFSFDDENGFNGISLESNFGGEAKRFKYFGMLQYAVAVDYNDDFAYSYIESSLRISKKIRLNLSCQIFKSISYRDVWVDVGPQIFVSFGKFYFKPWFTYDPGHESKEKVIVGIGYHY